MYKLQKFNYAYSLQNELGNIKIQPDSTDEDYQYKTQIPVTLFTSELKRVNFMNIRNKKISASIDVEIFSFNYL